VFCETFEMDMRASVGVMKQPTHPPCQLDLRT
jgi:hypothetical protein